MATIPEKKAGLAYRIGCWVSDKVSDLFAHPYAQVAFILVCVTWFVAGLNVNILTAALSIMAITLTQMVLNRQNEREIDDHRRDVAMHAKLDELIAATHRAKNEFVGIEEREEEEIVQLKEEVKEAIEETPVPDPAARETAKRAVDKATEEITGKSRKKPARSKARRKASPPKR
jgi:low affinity Fe/Cu permease